MAIIFFIAAYIVTFFILRKKLWVAVRGDSVKKDIAKRSLFIAVVATPSIMPGYLASIPIFAIIVLYNYLWWLVYEFHTAALILGALFGIVPILITWGIIFSFMLYKYKKSLRPNKSLKNGTREELRAP